MLPIFRIITISIIDAAVAVDTKCSSGHPKKKKTNSNNNNQLFAACCWLQSPARTIQMPDFQMAGKYILLTTFAISWYSHLTSIFASTGTDLAGYDSCMATHFNFSPCRSRAVGIWTTDDTAHVRGLSGSVAFVSGCIGDSSWLSVINVIYIYIGFLFCIFVFLGKWKTQRIHTNRPTHSQHKHTERARTTLHRPDSQQAPSATTN